MATQEGQERYRNKATADATDISQNDNNFVDAADNLDAERMEMSAAMARSQRARGLTNNLTRTAEDIDAEVKEKSETMERLDPTRNLVDQTTEEVNAIFGGGNSWGNDSAPLSAPLTLRIYGGAALTTTQ